MRFGTIDTFFALSKEDLRIGRNVANHEFMKALLTYGTFDAYHIFLPDIDHLEVFQRRLAQIIPDRALRARVHPTVRIALKESLSELEFTAFHLGDFTRYLPYLAPLRARHAKRPFPLTGVTHSLDTYIMPQRYLQLGLAGLEPFDAIICSSQAGREVVERSFGLVRSRLKEQVGLDIRLEAQLAHIPLGIEDDRFRVPSREKARGALGLPQEGTFLLVLGRLSSRSKMDLRPLIYQLARRWQKGELLELKLLLAGGAEARELEALRALLHQMGVSEQVFFKIDFPPELKSALYAASDLFVSLADNVQETFGLTVLEAMAAGIPPIVSDFDGYRELVLEGQTGHRIPTLWGGRIDALEGMAAVLSGAEALYYSQTFAVDLEAAMLRIEKLALDYNYRKSLGKMASSHAEKYRWSAIIGEYEKLWMRLSSQALKSALPRVPPHPLETDAWQSFQHYPTHWLLPETRLRVVPFGREVSEGAPLPPAEQNFKLLLHKPLLLALLDRLKRGAATVEALGDCAAELDVPSHLVPYHLLWLAKYGMVGPDAALSPRDVRARS